MKDADKAVVLVVDDSAIARQVVKDTLECTGSFRVVTLESAFGFIRTIREEDPALLLVDVGLASMNGKKLVALGRQHAPRRTCIVLYSGRSAHELSADAEECGADGFICKMTTGQALVSEVHGFLGIKQQRRG